MDIEMFNIFWVKSNRYWYVGYVLSQAKGILICSICFESSPRDIEGGIAVFVTVYIKPVSAFPQNTEEDDDHCAGLKPEKSETFLLFSCFSFNAFLIQSPCSPAWWTWVVTWSSWSRQTTRESSSTEARPTRQTWRWFQNSSWQFADKLGAHTFILILYFHNDLVEIDPHRLPTRFWRSTGSLCITRLTRKWSTTYTM